jgi:ABC-type nickel/cobalt efflux system permease component RcnA
MQNQFFSLLQSIFQKGLPFALSFVDDALLLAATRMGLHLPWLQWASTVLLISTVLYWTVRLLRFLYFKSLHV